MAEGLTKKSFIRNCVNDFANYTIFCLGPGFNLFRVLSRYGKVFPDSRKPGNSKCSAQCAGSGNGTSRHSVVSVCDAPTTSSTQYFASIITYLRWISRTICAIFDGHKFIVKPLIQEIFESTTSSKHHRDMLDDGEEAHSTTVCSSFVSSDIPTPLGRVQMQHPW